MIKKIWQWLKNFFQGLFARKKVEKIEQKSEEQTLTRFTDTDFEFLFNELLEGVAHGWQAPRIQKFFEQTADRATLTEWVNWLIGFGHKVLSSSQPNLELARRLELLAAQTQYLTGYSEIGAAGYAIATELFKRQGGGEVWEYEGPDLGMGMQEGSNETISGEKIEMITLEELLERLKADENLRKIVAQQVEVDSDDPMVILQALVAKMPHE